MALSTQGAHHGLLLLARNKDSVRYARTDIEMGAVFGSHVALALELARMHRLREELLVFTDRDRIARDLHDLVIQRLFAAGLSVQSLTRFTKDELALERIRAITGELDEAIRSLRDTIYSLKSSSGETELLSGRIRRVTRVRRNPCRLPPRLTITGPVDAVTPDKADNVVAVVSEGLSNAIRHSGADTISVSVAVVKGQVTVVISDNGAGFAEPGKTQRTEQPRGPGAHARRRMHHHERARRRHQPGMVGAALTPAPSRRATAALSRAIVNRGA